MMRSFFVTLTLFLLILAWAGWPAAGTTVERVANPTHEPLPITYPAANGLNAADRKELHGLTKAITIMVNSEGDTVLVGGQAVAKAPVLEALKARKAKIMEKWEPDTLEERNRPASQ